MTLNRYTTLFTCVLFCCLFVAQPALAQNYTVKGKVTDKETGEPMPYTNVFIPGKFVGTSTDLDGNYELQVNKRADSIGASALGYTELIIPLTKQDVQVVNFEMSQDMVNIGVVEVVAGEDPADILFKKILKRKKYNNYERYNSIQYEAYTKYEIDLLDFTKESIDDNKLLARFPVLKDYVDTASDEGTSLLRIFLIENLSDNYSEKNPPNLVEKVKAVKMSGLSGSQDFITDLLSNVNQNFNVYENLITVMGKNLVSPLADYGLSVYRYDITIYDTLYIEGEPYMEMKFRPRRKGENTFEGKMFINLNDLGVHSITCELSKDVNVNLIDDLSFTHQYRKAPYQVTPDSTAMAWVPKKEKLRITFNYAFGKETRILGLKTKSFADVKLNEPIDPDVYTAFEVTDIEKEAYDKSDEYWEENRHESLEKTEEDIYVMVDSLKSTRKFKRLVFIAQSLSSGYIPVGYNGPVGLGHIASFFSRNDHEGFRLRLGAKTNKRFSERIQLEGFVAYGFRDERFKYGGRVQVILSKKPWHNLNISARTDIDFKSKHAEEMNQDNVFTLIQKPVEQKIYNIEEYKIRYDFEAHKDLTVYLTAQHRVVLPFFDFSYVREGETEVRKDIITSEFDVAFRWQFKSAQLPGTFNRDAKANKFFASFRKKTTFPFVWLRYTGGVKDLIGSDFNYHNIALGLQGDITLTAKMSMYYNLWAGQIFGTVPYLLLKVPEGNNAYVHNKYFFNNMNLLEFAADRYVSLNYQWFLGGLIFDKIPGLKKLGWREVITANVFWGDMTQANTDFNSRNTFSVADKVPYVEAGVGIENVFKILRIDSIWRITNRDYPRTINWGLYVSMFIKV